MADSSKNDWLLKQTSGIEQTLDPRLQRRLPPSHALRWLVRGWKDLWLSPWSSLAYGLLVFTGVFVQPASHYERVMSLPLLRHLGHISYGIFCIHLPVLHLVMWMTGYELFDGHLLQILGLTLLLSLAAAELLYRAVELPFMRLRDLGPGGRTVATSPTQSTASTR